MNRTRAAQLVLVVIALAIGWVGRGLWEDLETTPEEMGVHVDGASTKPMTDRESKVRPQPLPKEIEQVALAIRAGEYARALDLVETLERSELEFHMGKLRFLAEAQRLSPADALELMQSYVALYNRDVPALWLLAELYQRNGRMQAALEPLYGVVRETGDAEERERARQRIKLLVDAIAQGLAQRGELANLKEFGDELIELDPHDEHYRYLAALWAVEAADPVAARAHLELLPTYAISDAELHRLETRIERLEAAGLAGQGEGAIRIPLQREGGRLLVRARLDERQTIRMLVDTGASISALKPHVVRGARRGPEISIRTASGVVRAPLITLESLELDQLKVEALPVAVMELEDLGEVDGVLGMDVLGQLDLSLDQDVDALVVQATQ
jgi:predicted aspartyl protease